MSYEAPAVTALGSLEELTQVNINKTPGGTDTITVSGSAPVSVPGSQIVP